MFRVLSADESTIRFSEIWAEIKRSADRDMLESPADICARLATGAAVAVEIEAGMAWAILEVLQYGQVRVLHIRHVAGAGLANWLDEAVNWCKRYAVEQQCTALRYHGRAGWSKLVPGSREVSREFEINLGADDGRK